MNKEIQNKLLSLKDEKFKDFSCALIPNIDRKRVIGVRAPQLKGLAKELYANESEYNFLHNLPHSYLEENTLHAYLINCHKNFEKTIELINQFLPHVDNWATCDSLRPICFKNHKEKLLQNIYRWLKSSHTYTVRFAIEMLMIHFLDDAFNQDFLHSVAKVKSGEYYVNMMLAWFFATALAKQWQSAIIFLEDGKLDRWVHNKTIRKAIESYRITKKQKEYLRSLILKE